MRAGDSHDLALLRTVALNCARKELTFQATPDQHLRALGFATALYAGDALVGILTAGGEAFADLVARLFSADRAWQRGATYADFSTHVLSHIVKKHLGVSANNLKSGDVTALLEDMDSWFIERSGTRAFYIPAMLSPYRSQRFEIGPVILIHINDFQSSELYAAREIPEYIREDMDKLLEHAAEQSAHWMAVVQVEGCDQKRAEEVGDLSVDLAICGIQISAPYLARDLCRLRMHRGTTYYPTLSVSDGSWTTGTHNRHPGVSIGENYLGKLFLDSQNVIRAVGECVKSFASGQFRLAKLEQSWCDAAYWYQQGIGENIDSIAVAKLETSIEVLLDAGSASGSEARIRTALRVFFALSASDPINPTSGTSAKQFAKTLVMSRSRILHGNWSTLDRRIDLSRDGLERFAAALLREFVFELSGYIKSVSAVDRLDEFLIWAESSRATRAARATAAPKL